MKYIPHVSVLVSDGGYMPNMVVVWWPLKPDGKAGKKWVTVCRTWEMFGLN